MRSMLMLLMILIMYAEAVFGAEEKEILNFVKSAIAVNRSYKVKDVKIKSKENIKDPKGWSVYFIQIDLVLTYQNNKVISINDMIFSNGKYISKDFINIKTKRSLKKEISPKVEARLYNKKHLLYGNYKALNKILVFSDPMCPFCIDFVPKLIKFVQKHPNDFALFYYHLPLSALHPPSKTLVKAILVAEKLGVKDIVKRVYNEDFDPINSDVQAILDEFNKKFSTKITKKDIEQKDILQRYEEDIKEARNLMVNGTPTIFVNGKKDPTREAYKKLAKD